jgi:replication-associated recombination protein RarA
MIRDLNLKSARSMTIVGPNGVGKTALARLLASGATKCIWAYRGCGYACSTPHHGQFHSYS